jgi:hypothetical protein
VDLRLVSQASYGAALHYFTGSKAHNIAVRKIAVGKGLKINEYGVFRGEKKKAGRTEKEVYEAVDLRYIEPELREDRGEIEAARKGRLPDLVTVEDIRGDLHTHTKATDGRFSPSEMPNGTSLGTPCTVEVIGATTAVRRCASATGRESTSTGRRLSGRAKRYIQTSPRATRRAMPAPSEARTCRPTPRRQHRRTLARTPRRSRVGGAAPGKGATPAE